MAVVVCLTGVGLVPGASYRDRMMILALLEEGAGEESGLSFFRGERGLQRLRNLLHLHLAHRGVNRGFYGPQLAAGPPFLPGVSLCNGNGGSVHVGLVRLLYWVYFFDFCPPLSCAFSVGGLRVVKSDLCEG